MEHRDPSYYTNEDKDWTLLLGKSTSVPNLLSVGPPQRGVPCFVTVLQKIDFKFEHKNR